MKIVIDIKQEEDKTATTKARCDVNQILVSEGFEVKYINVIKGNSYKILLKNINYSYNQLKKILSDLSDDSTVVFQYPFDSMSYKFSTIIKEFKNKKNLKTIALIHDINGLRTSSFFGKQYFNFIIKETKFLNNFDKIICHNDKMKKYLIENNILENKIITLNLFDYLCDKKSEKINYKDYNSVNIAGNLSPAKSGYVYKLGNLELSKIKINLFGVNYEKIENKKINYLGSFKPEALINKINSGFGIVWDGTDIDCCNGTFGNYLKYNNPHKFSLYMAAGIPVVVWAKSALAEFVKKNNIGIVVESLNNIDELINDISEKEYKKMCKNVEKIQKKVVEGKYLKEALKKAINK